MSTHLAEKRQVQENLKRLCVSGKNQELCLGSVQRLCSCKVERGNELSATSVAHVGLHSNSQNAPSFAPFFSCL